MRPHARDVTSSFFELTPPQTVLRSPRFAIGTTQPARRRRGSGFQGKATQGNDFEGWLTSRPSLHFGAWIRHRGANPRDCRKRPGRPNPVERADLRASEKGVQRKFRGSGSPNITMTSGNSALARRIPIPRASAG